MQARSRHTWVVLISFIQPNLHTHTQKCIGNSLAVEMRVQGKRTERKKRSIGTMGPVRSPQRRGGRLFGKPFSCGLPFHSCTTYRQPCCEDDMWAHLPV